MLTLRPDERDDRLVGLLTDSGYEVISCPLTAILPPRDVRPLERGVRDLLGGRFQVLLLTSARAAEVMAASIRNEGGRIPDDVEVWAVGESTARVAGRLGLPVHRVPATFVAEGLLEEAPTWRSLDGLTLFFPRAEAGRELLPEALASCGVRLTLVAAYRNAPRPEAPDEAARLALGGAVDAVLLTAGSQARLLAEGAVRVRGEDPALAAAGFPPLLALGSATRGAAIDSGLPDPAVAEPHTFEGLVALLVRRHPP